MLESQILTYLDLKACHNLANCIQGKVYGVVFKSDGFGKINAFSTQTMNGGNDRKDQSPMMLVIDGVPRPDFAVSDLAVHDVQSIEVLRTVGKLNVYGLKGNNGVIVITTKQGGIDYNEEMHPANESAVKSKNTFWGTAKGYYSTRLFYAPVYSATETGNTFPDMRSTIYWRPQLVTDEDGAASLEFYNSDGVGKYKVVVEGLSESGKIGRQVYYYEVK